MTTTTHLTEFAAGAAPTTDQLLGPSGTSEWAVTMLTWELPWWCRWFAVAVSWAMSSALMWRKRFWRDGYVNGCNAIVIDLHWGFFERWSTADEVRLAYCDFQIVDLLRTTPDPDRLLGRFYFRGTFRGWFELRRLGESEKE